MGDNILRLTGGDVVCVAGVVAGDNTAKMRKKRTTSPTPWVTNPVWGGEMLTFEVDAQLAGVKVECWAKEKSGKTSLGEVLIPRASLPHNCEAESWYPLAPGRDAKPANVSNLRTSSSPAELYLRLCYQSVPTASPLKDRMKLRRRSSSLLRRQKRKELERIFPLAPEEELLRTKKCYLRKEKGRLYVTNLHVGFYEKNKAGVWLTYSQILHISVDGSDLFITDHNANEYCFHEGGKIYKVLYALWRGGNVVEELAAAEDSDSLGSDPSSPGPDPIAPRIRSVSDPHQPAIPEVTNKDSPPFVAKQKKFASLSRYRAFKGELNSLRTLSNSDGCLQAKLEAAEESSTTGRVRKRLSTGLRHFLRPAEVDKSKQQSQSPTPSPSQSPSHSNEAQSTAEVDLSTRINGSGSYNRDRIVFTMEDDDAEAEPEEPTEQPASNPSSSNEGLRTTIYTSNGSGSQAYATYAYQSAGAINTSQRNFGSRIVHRHYRDNEEEGEVEEDGEDDSSEFDQGDERERWENGLGSDDGQGDDEDEDVVNEDVIEEEEDEDEEDHQAVSLASGRSLSSIAVSIALGERDDITTEQLRTSTATTTTRTISIDEEEDGDALFDSAVASIPSRRSQSLILDKVTKRRGSNIGISSKSEAGTSQIRLLIKPSKSDSNTLVVKVISALRLDIPRECVCESVFVQVQYARQTQRTEAINGSSSSLFFNQKMKFNWIGGKSEFIDVTCWYIDPKRGRDVFIGQAVVPLPSPVHGVRSYRIDGWYELVDRRVKAVSQIRRRIGGVVPLPASPRGHASNVVPSESGSVVVRTRVTVPKLVGPDLHGSVVIHATGSEDQVSGSGSADGAGIGGDDDSTVLEQPFTDTVESYSFDDCDDTFVLDRTSLSSPRTEDDSTFSSTSRATTPRERASITTMSLRRSQALAQSQSPSTTPRGVTTASAPAAGSGAGASPTAAATTALLPTPSPSFSLYLVVVFAVLLVGALVEVVRRGH